MKKTTSASDPSSRHLGSVPDQPADREAAAERRAALRHRHVHSLTQLMAQRADLRGVNGFADFVDDAVRWTA